MHPLATTRLFFTYVFTIKYAANKHSKTIAEAVDRFTNIQFHIGDGYFDEFGTTVQFSLFEMRSLESKH